MYSIIDVVRAAETAAEDFIAGDRIRYLPYYIAVENFAHEHGLVVCGTAANMMLQDMNPTAYSGRYDLFSWNIGMHAKQLADIFFDMDPGGRGRYTTARTKVPNAFIVIDVDGRELVGFISLQLKGGVRLTDILMPSQRHALLTDAELRCSGAELQLIEIYSTLCNPAKVNLWAEALKDEAGLRSVFNSEIKEKLATAVGGVAGGGYGPTAEWRRFVHELRERFINEPGRILVGAVAAGALAVAPIRNGSSAHLQVVTENSFDETAEELLSLAKTVDVEIAWTVGDPSIPVDPRLRRMSVHVVAARKELVLEVYNTAMYELVPYLYTEPPAAITGGRRHTKFRDHITDQWVPPEGTKIGTPFTIMRFRLSDIWTILMLLKMQIIDVAYSRAVLDGMLKDYLVASSLIDRSEHLRLLPIDTYIGKLTDAETAQKREMYGTSTNSRSKQYYPPYMPLHRKRFLGLESKISQVELPQSLAA